MASMGTGFVLWPLHLRTQGFWRQTCSPAAFWGAIPRSGQASKSMLKTAFSNLVSARFWLGADPWPQCAQGSYFGCLWRSTFHFGHRVRISGAPADIWCTGFAPWALRRRFGAEGSYPGRSCLHFARRVRTFGAAASLLTTGFVPWARESAGTSTFYVVLPRWAAQHDPKHRVFSWFGQFGPPKRQKKSDFGEF